MRATLLVVFGAIPATILSLFGSYGVYLGLSAAMTQVSVDSVLLIICGVLGVFGAVALWRAALGRRASDLWPSIAAGQIAIILLLYFSVPSAESPRPTEVGWLADSPHWLALLSIAPFIVGIALLIQWASES